MTVILGNSIDAEAAMFERHALIIANLCPRRDFSGFGTKRGEERTSQTGVNQILQSACRASSHRISGSQDGQILPECRISDSRRPLGGFGKRRWLSSIAWARIRFASARRRRALVAATAEKTGRARTAGATKRLPRRKAPNQLFLGWLASDGHGAYRDHPGRLRCLARLTRMAVALAGDVLAYSRKSICPIGE